MSSKKPMSSMRSASSSTRVLSASSVRMLALQVVSRGQGCPPRCGAMLQGSASGRASRPPYVPMFSSARAERSFNRDLVGQLRVGQLHQRLHRKATGVEFSPAGARTNPDGLAAPVLAWAVGFLPPAQAAGYGAWMRGHRGCSQLLQVRQRGRAPAPACWKSVLAGFFGVMGRIIRPLPLRASEQYPAPSRMPACASTPAPLPARKRRRRSPRPPRFCSLRAPAAPPSMRVPRPRPRLGGRACISTAAAAACTSASAASKAPAIIPALPWCAPAMPRPPGCP